MEKIKKLKKILKREKIDGYIIPKNDEFFAEYSKQDRLKIISNFSGSAGYAIILKNKNYLFVDGRYTIQAQIESGKNFKIMPHPLLVEKNNLKMKNKKIGFDPRLFNENFIKKFSNKLGIKCVAINTNLVKLIKEKKTYLVLCTKWCCRACWRTALLIIIWRIICPRLNLRAAA